MSYNQEDVIRIAAQQLVDRLEAMHNDDHYKAVWFCYANHGGDYSNGPKYDKELANLKQVLRHASAPRKIINTDKTV